MTGACDFRCVAPGSCGIPPFEVRVDRSIFCRYYHPTRFAPARRRSLDRFEIVSCVDVALGCDEIRRSLYSIPGESPKLRVPMRHNNLSIRR
jgi:hypothetical protein